MFDITLLILAEANELENSFDINNLTLTEARYVIAYDCYVRSMGDYSENLVKTYHELEKQNDPNFVMYVDDMFCKDLVKYFELMRNATVVVCNNNNYA